MSDGDMQLEICYLKLKAIIADDHSLHCENF